TYESSSLTPFSAPLVFSRSPEVNSSTTEEKEMFGRQVTLKLKTNSATELNRISADEVLPILRKQKGFRDETTFIAPERSEAIVNSFWDTKADAEAYDHTAYVEVLKTLSNVIDGTPTVKTFEFANSTFHQVTPSRLM